MDPDNGSDSMEADGRINSSGSSSDDMSIDSDDDISINIDMTVNDQVLRFGPSVGIQQDLDEDGIGSTIVSSADATHNNHPVGNNELSNLLDVHHITRGRQFLRVSFLVHMILHCQYCKIIDYSTHR